MHTWAIQQKLAWCNHKKPHDSGKKCIEKYIENY